MAKKSQISWSGNEQPSRMERYQDDGGYQMPVMGRLKLLKSIFLSILTYASTTWGRRRRKEEESFTMMPVVKILKISHDFHSKNFLQTFLLRCETESIERRQFILLCR